MSAVSQSAANSLNAVLRRSVAPSLPLHWARRFIQDQCSVISYLLPPALFTPKQQDHSFTTSEGLWKAVWKEQIRANTVVHLNGFMVSEWLPRAPGVFHTPRAQQSREEAMRYVLPPPPTPTHSTDPVVVLDPHGKLSMIDGGVGCVRLKPLTIGTHDLWFLGATSSLDVHEGLPIALPDLIYQRHIDRIARGGLSCTVTGRLRFIPQQLAPLYGYGHHIPQIYIEVDRLQPARRTILELWRRPGLLVSAAVGFRSSYEDRDSLYASFVTFSSASQASMLNAVEWLDQAYVQGLYKGQVVTDFDEQSTHFAGAAFSLERLLHKGLDKKTVRATIKSLSLGKDAANIIIEHVDRVHMSQSKTITIGAGARVSAPVTIADTITGSFNVIRKSGADPKMKEALERLLSAIQKVESQAPQQTKSMATNVRRLAKEASRKKPRKSEARSRIESITKAAKAIGSIGKPIIKLASQVLSFFG